MARIGFVGPSYSSQSLNADAQATINQYVEQNESGQGKSGFAMYPSPGLRQFAALGGGPERGGIAINPQSPLERVFFVSGGTLYEVFQNAQPKDWGNVANDGLPASLAASPTQLLIASDGISYVFDLLKNTLNQVQALAGIAIAEVGFTDGFFLALQANSQLFYASSPEDATTWDLLNFGDVSVFPDVVLAMLVDHREIVLFGGSKTVFYYDSGNADFPFDVTPGSFIEMGIAAPASATRLDNSVFWIGADERGAGVGWRAQGYSPARITNHAIEYEWSTYRDAGGNPAIKDAIGYAFQDQGHTFWHVYFPTANKSWRYDVATGMWHQVGFWNQKKAAYDAHRSRCHVFGFGRHLVGDWASGNVYQMAIPQAAGAAWSFADDFGNSIRRLRRTPVVATEEEWMYFDDLTIDAEMGLGPEPPLTGPFDGPEAVILQDANGVLWTVTIADDGTLHTAQGAAGAAQKLILNDSQNGTTSWQLVISVGGAVSGKAVTFGAQYKQIFPMATSQTAKQSGFTMSNAGAVGQVQPYMAARDPQGELRWSDDGGKTWSNPRILKFGKAGNTKVRAIARRLGRARKGRVFELVVTDPIPWRFVDAYLRGTGFQPSERLVKQIGKSA